MKKILIISFFTLGSLSTAFAGGANCAAQNKAAAEKADARRRAMMVLSSNEAYSSKAKSGSTVK